MNVLVKGLVLGAVQLALVAGIGGKFLYDRANYPRVWAETAPYDPDLPIRGRYVGMVLLVETARQPAPKPEADVPELPTMFSANLEVHNDRLHAIEDENGRHLVASRRCGEAECWQLLDSTRVLHSRRCRGSIAAPGGRIALGRSCLGQQLLFEASEEGEARGFGLLPGKVVRLPASPQAVCPHMGWSKLARTRDSALLEGVLDGDYVYFVHSYICPVDAETIATAHYGAAFAAAVAKHNVYGCQFHPERSGVVGARILANFLSLPC